jgi:hypothetical protein
VEGILLVRADRVGDEIMHVIHFGQPSLLDKFTA